MSLRITLPAPAGPGAPPFQTARSMLPPPLRPDASLAVLNATEWFGETSGGIRTYLLEKARYVRARPQFRQTIVVPGALDSVEDERGVRLLRLQGPAIPKHRPYRFMLAVRSVTRIVRHERPDIIEAGSPFLAPWIVRLASRRQGTPLVYYHHTDIARVVSNAFAPGSRAQRHVINGSWRYLRQIAQRCAVTVVATEGGKQELLANGFTRVAHIPLGVDLDTFHPVRRIVRQVVRERLALPDAPIALFAGRFAREKELDVLLGSWARVEQQTGARLVLVGAGPHEARLRAHPYGSRVLFRPFVHDRETLADVLAAADIYVAPGPAETFGLAAVEAMACGIPVLSVGRGAVAEHVARSARWRMVRCGQRSECRACCY